MTTMMNTKTIKLEVHICDQRRSYLATFMGSGAEDQAIAFIERKSATHAFHEVPAEPVYPTFGRLLETLYPTCEHGMSASLCSGPNHWYYDDEEQARGLGSW